MKNVSKICTILYSQEIIVYNFVVRPYVLPSHNYILPRRIQITLHQTEVFIVKREAKGSRLIGKEQTERKKRKEKTKGGE